MAIKKKGTAISDKALEAKVAAKVAKLFAKKNGPKKPRGPGNPISIAPYKFPKGVSGNPSGRPKEDVAAKIARAIFENNEEAIYQKLCEQFLVTGDMSYFEALSNRGFGKLTDKQELTGADGQPLTTLPPNVQVNFVAPEPTPKEEKK